MSLQRKLGFVGLVLVAVCVVPALGGMYDYSEGGMDGSDWSLQKHDAGYIDVVYSSSIYSDSVLFVHQFNQATSYRSREAMVWEAPEGEYITQVQFNWDHNLSPWAMSGAVFLMGETEYLNGSTTMTWTSSGEGWAEGSETLTFTEAQHVTKIGLGFATHDCSYPGWSVSMKDPVITTAPEPATMGLLTIGGLGVLLRRKR